MQLQRYSDLGQLGMTLCSVRLREDTLVDSAAGEQGRMFYVLSQLRNIVARTPSWSAASITAWTLLPAMSYVDPIALPRIPWFRDCTTSLAVIFRTVTATPFITWPSHGGRSLSDGSERHRL
jgi:hypothetical protein